MGAEKNNYRKREGKTLASNISLYKQCSDFGTSTVSQRLTVVLTKLFSYAEDRFLVFARSWLDI